MLRLMTAAILFSALAASTVHAATPPITLDYPRGGELFIIGTTQRVALAAKIKPKSVKVELSRDGGTTFETLGTIQIVKGSAPRLSFPVAAPASGDCVVRVSDAANPAIQAVSAPFNIAAALGGPVNLADGTVTALKLADGSVTNPKLAAGAVTSDKVSSGQSSTNFLLTSDGAGGAAWVAPAAVNSVQDFTGALQGDVTGVQNATVVTRINGVSAATLASGASLAAASTDQTSANTIVRRDASGNFSAATVSANLSGNVTGNVTGSVSGNLTGNVTGNVSGTSSGFTGNLAGDVSGPQGATVVAQVGGLSAASLAASAALANSATGQNTSNAVVRRDALGNFSAGTITANLAGNVSGTAGSISGVVSVVHGGTGQTSFSAGEVLIGNSAGALSKGVLTGTNNQITVINGNGTIAISAAQDLATNSSPAFASVTAEVSLTSPILDSPGELQLSVAGGQAMRIFPAVDPATDAATIIGGFPANTITAGAKGCVIAGGGFLGALNRVTDDYCTVGGGKANQAGDNAGSTTDMSYATVAGGANNQARGRYAAIAGGYFNTATLDYASVAGGSSNNATAYASTVSGGESNNATGVNSTIPGGAANTAAASYSFATGYNAKVNAAHSGASLFADDNAPAFNSAAAREFAVRATGGVRLVTAIDGSGNPTQALRVTSAGNVGIGGVSTPAASNLLELTSTSKGLVIPRMTKTQRNAIASPIAGMVVYQTDNTPGLRVYNNAGNWMRFTETTDN